MKKILLLICLPLFTLNFSQITEGNIVTQPIDTKAFVPYTPAPDIDGSNKGSFFNDAKLTEFKPVQGPQYKRAEEFDLNRKLESVKSERNEAKSADEIVDEMFPDKDKLDLTTTVDLRDTHELSSNGTIWIPKEKKVDTEEISISQQPNTTRGSSDTNIITTFLGISFVIIIGVIGILLFVFTKKKNDNSRTIIVSDGGEPEMREFMRSMFKRLENEVRNNETHLSTISLRERIIEVILNVSQNLLHHDISKFQIKYKISALDSKRIINEEVSRFVVIVK